MTAAEKQSFVRTNDKAPDEKGSPKALVQACFDESARLAGRGYLVFSSRRAKRDSKLPHLAVILATVSSSFRNLGF